MKQLLAVIAVLCVFSMTACSHEKNEVRNKVDRPPGSDDETVLEVTLQNIDTECDLPETEQVAVTETLSETTAIESKHVTTEPVTVFAESDMPIISTETTAVQMFSEKPPETKPLPPVTTTASNTETGVTNETVTVSFLNIEDIWDMCICTAKNMGYSQDAKLTPENSSWWNPITVPVNDDRQSIERIVTEYIQFHTPDNLMAYGLGEITCFNIYAEKQVEGVYRIYFLFA